MADRNDIHPLNVPGKFYNDLSCTDCDLCREIAPDIFKRDDDEALTYVVRQPASEVEEVLAMEALDACPTETIGCDGQVGAA